MRGAIAGCGELVREGLNGSAGPCGRIGARWVESVPDAESKMLTALETMPGRMRRPDGWGVVSLVAGRCMGCKTELLRTGAIGAFGSLESLLAECQAATCFNSPVDGRRTGGAVNLENTGEFGAGVGAEGSDSKGSTIGPASTRSGSGFWSTCSSGRINLPGVAFS
jgi:hypothetical protein